MGRKKDPTKYQVGQPCVTCNGIEYYKNHQMKSVCVKCHQNYCRSRYVPGQKAKEAADKSASVSLLQNVWK